MRAVGIKIGKYDQNNKYVNVQKELNSNLQYKNKENQKIQNPNQKPAVIQVWQPNTIMHPPDQNAEYDIMDKNQSLRDLPLILEDI